jgi:hypothetical protein
MNVRVISARWITSGSPDDSETQMMEQAAIA